MRRISRGGFASAAEAAAVDSAAGAAVTPAAAKIPAIKDIVLFVMQLVYHNLPLWDNGHLARCGRVELSRDRTQKDVL